MRRARHCLLLLLAACSETGGGTPDATAPDASAPSDVHQPDDAFIADAPVPIDLAPKDAPDQGTFDAAPTTDGTALDAPPPESADTFIDARGLDSLVPTDTVSRPEVPPADTGTRPLDSLEALFERRFSPITSASRFSVPASAAYHCLAAASAYRRARAGAAFAPAFRDALRDATTAAANSLVATAPRWGGAGWGLDMAWDAFGDGSTNPASTVYAFQTGLAIWCLVEAADALDAPSYRALAARSLAAYRSGAYVNSSGPYPLPCSSCGYFFYSMNRNDRGRLVKNTNIEMAMASLALHRYGADSTALATGAAATLSQYGEVHSYSNYDYLSRYDPRYRVGASAFDDHNSFEAYLLLRASQLLRRSDFQSAAVAHFNAFAPRGTEAYVAYAACHFARILPTARSTCVRWVEAHGATNPAGVGLVMDY